jgi:choline dehydrogenase-like flavoprotein
MFMSQMVQSFFSLEFKDLQWHMGTFNFGVDFGTRLKYIWGYNTTMWNHLYEDRSFEQGFGMMPTLLRPKSRGSVTLASGSIHDDPIIDANYLDHADDVRTLVEGMKFLKSLEETDEFKKFGIEMMVDRLLCGEHELYSDEYYECYVREYISTVFHPVSTCAMGPKSSKEAVVDHRYKLPQNSKGVILN